MSDELGWFALAGLGAYHGLNPAMGWLFAVSLGMQQRSRGAVLRALGPIALGHELALGLVAVIVLVAAASVDMRALQVGGAVILLAFGVFRFARPRAHPRWTRMRVSARELTLWSFLMSSAHGAGLMIAPVLIGTASARSGHDEPHVGLATLAAAPEAALGILLHIAVMVAVMGIVAVVVYEKVGLGVLRKAWLNTDQLWAGAFVVAAAVTLLS